MRSPKAYIIGSLVIDIALIAYLFTLIDQIGLGLVLTLSVLLLGASFITIYFMKRS